jgi:hypothetical protein
MDYTSLIATLQEHLRAVERTIAKLEEEAHSPQATLPKRGRKAMGAAERRQVSARIKRYWARRRAAESNGTPAAASAGPQGDAACDR